jgi:Rrf2 family protein
MNHFGAAVEYGLHVMTHLARFPGDSPPSAKALAEFLGVPPAYLAKIMTKLEKAGLLAASEGKGGGYRLARTAADITFLEVADAIEGRKSLFECKDVRLRCVLFGGSPPKAARAGVCSIHAVMLAAERHMRETLGATTVADISRPLEARTPSNARQAVQNWFAHHALSHASNAPPSNIADTGDPK